MQARQGLSEPNPTVACDVALAPRVWSNAGAAGVRGFDGMLTIGILLLAFQLLGPVLTIPLHVPLNYNEGWNATFDTRAVLPGSGPLYPPVETFVFNNYPPLGFYLVGSLGRFVFGDMIVAGRVVALLSLLGSGAMVSLCLRYLGAGRRAALASATLLLLFVNSYFKKYVAVDDPQWLAHAFMLGGLTVLFGNGGVRAVIEHRQSPARLIAAALCVATGGFVKHNLVALPVSITLWLLWVNRKAALAWLATALLAASVGVGMIAMLYGHDAFADILHHRRVFRVGLASHALTGLAPLVPMAIVVAGVLWPTWRHSSAERRAGLLFVALFGGVAIPTGIVQRMGEGVYYNAHFETLIALSLGFGLALSSVCTTPLRWRNRVIGPVALSVFVAMPLICAWPWHLPRAWRDIDTRNAQVAAWKPLIDQIAATKGPVACLMMQLCWWAGKPSEIDMFNLTESVVMGGPIGALRTNVLHMRFALLQDFPKSFTHMDAIRQLGYDPVMSLFAKTYAAVAYGPDGAVLLAPKSSR